MFHFELSTPHLVKQLDSTYLSRESCHGPASLKQQYIPYRPGLVSDYTASTNLTTVFNKMISLFAAGIVGFFFASPAVGQFGEFSVGSRLMLAVAMPTRRFSLDPESHDLSRVLICCCNESLDPAWHCQNTLRTPRNLPSNEWFYSR